MKSDICKLTKDASSLNDVLSVTQRVAEYGGLDHKETNKMRLLAEELICMLPELLSFSNGEFWAECNGKSFELHVALAPDKSLSAYKRDRLLAVSTTGKNEAAKGIMNKIRLAVQFMLTDYNDIASFYQSGMPNDTAFWSLEQYRHKAQAEKGEPWDELERSIIANIADDLLIGIQGKQVDIVVKKSF